MSVLPCSYVHITINTIRMNVILWDRSDGFSLTHTLRYMSVINNITVIIIILVLGIFLSLVKREGCYSYKAWVDQSMFKLEYRKYLLHNEIVWEHRDQWLH